MLDRCYRGRRQLACRFEAISAEGKSLTEEFTRIVEEHYPEIGNVEGICKISFDSLAKDFAGTAEFNKRFNATRSEFDARTTCANKVKQAIQDLALADLAQGTEVQKSMVEAVDQEISKVSAVQEQVAGLAGKLQSSQKAIAVLQNPPRNVFEQHSHTGPVAKQRPTGAVTSRLRRRGRKSRRRRRDDNGTDVASAKARGAGLISVTEPAAVHSMISNTR